jgi:copper chaperone CopZ
MTETSHMKATAGHACDGMGKDASAGQCGVKAGQVMYSFAVAGVDCERCVSRIQKAAMATKGIHCAHVDLSSKTAYIIADKSMDQKAITKVIETAGFKNNYKGTGPAVEAEFTKMMSTGSGASCCMKKNKEKV